ncbi:class I SAM-dependent methyltransferase [Hyphococcus luteus]|uniref:SAM-dependent methyltransferase n=1 Tax=Hyphococcus luteus TaxID=2058213 RepID=A0A2S7K6S9_9PROT|nr:class I SAM-dependent methyltransferase [Marinicaulis flavus]PQA88213.1 SAM-dependent methyltransferase [Marinicaulis flavus]
MADNQPPSQPFNKDHAEAYDARWKPLSPLSEAMHLLSRGALDGLADNARILCAGVGTGAEILYLGKIYPGWRFTGFDPSEAMLGVCRANLDAAGLSDRCELHHGVVDTLPQSAPFDAATSFLVSHFLTDTDERGAFFHAVAQRLRPGGVFVNADLAPDRSDSSYPALMDIWLNTLALADMDEAGRDRYEEMFGKAVAAHTPEEVEALIAANGFDRPVRYYQAAMIYVWAARKSAA